LLTQIPISQTPHLSRTTSLSLPPLPSPIRHGHGQVQPLAAAAATPAAAVVLHLDRRLLVQVSQQVLLQDLKAVVHRFLHESGFPVALPVSPSPSPSLAGTAVLPPGRSPAAPAPGLQHRQVQLPRRRAEAHGLPVAPPPAAAHGPCDTTPSPHHGASASPAASPHHGASAAADGDTVASPPHPAAAAGRAARASHPGCAGALPAAAAPGGLHVRGVAYLRLHAPAPRDALADPRAHVAARVRLPALAADAAISGRADAGHQPPRPRPVTLKQSKQPTLPRRRRCVDTAGCRRDLARKGGSKRYDYVLLARTQFLCSTKFFLFLASCSALILCWCKVYMGHSAFGDQ
jgi:hypothetical protein